ncbi:translation initiation factor IF-2 [secondary endosymbiont of Heteropsylla cubana]|uniref:Translation initiation factor IF-2 n=1 Tax=secondary endosymbiont of Heteropsylla cubana TaxID=134287 RepID=J7GTL3_9ENTR|nr:translation initiation factor IF-2 [secondary endosymbiont of Heteropsylla cubana]AFP85879.1 translation initiation factor IF-2 [secondary endosymbiont of Heteropsylla cubana]
MTDVTVKSLASEIQIPVDRLIQHFADAGINKTIVDSVTQKEKATLLTYLNRNRGRQPNKLTLKRKTRSTLNIPSSGGKSKAIQIEIRKNRTYISSNPQKQEKGKTHNIEQKSDIEKETGKKNADLNSLKNTKYTLEKKSWHEDIVQAKNVLSKSKQLVNKQIKNINHLPQKTRKMRREAEAIDLRRKSEEETRRKIEEKARQVAEEARLMAEEHSNRWNNISEISEEDDSDYHITTSHHAREAEDENDRKVEGDRRIRSRSGKLNKQKKNSRLFETKSDREEARTVGRGNKGKRKTSTLTQVFNKPSQAINRDVVIGQTITIADLANKMAVKGSQVIKVMMKLGTMATINQVVDQEIAQVVAEEMGHKVILRHENELEKSIMSDRDTGSINTQEVRSPVVTIMGHVDHGKTSLLDYIRSTKVAINEAGGITQHIGAYHVKTNQGNITFLDTPGHSAFTSMRARGAQITDIVVLVVASDDGVMPQTIEAIQHSKTAKVPVVVAINKIDKPESDPDRIKNELSQHGIIPDEWGGDSQFVCVSAKSGSGIDELLDAILLQAQVLELKAISNGMANGVVIESFLDKGRGPVASILVREGTLHRGDIVLCGFEYGRIRAMRNELGSDISSAGPSIPVEILGLSGVPAAGDAATVVRDEKKAREVALHRLGKFRDIKLANQKKSKLDGIFANLTDSEMSELNIVLKSDVQGSSEAISAALNQLSTEEVRVKILFSGVGGITETDATLAAASKAILIGFNVRADGSARRVIESENLNLSYYSVIYDLIHDVKTAMSKMLTPEYKQEIIGLAEVRDVFRSPKFGSIAGCMVTEGIVKRHNKIRILRKNIVIHEGELESLRRFKDDVNEVRNGMECGIGIKNYNDVHSGDIIEIFETIEIPRTIT